MEPNFQTSFIPKKSMVIERTSSSRPIGFFTLMSVFILLAVVLATGGLFLYKGIMEKKITEKQASLNLAKNDSDFQPAKITQLKVLDKRLKASTEILSKHIAVTPIFQALQAITMKNVRYTKFGYSFADETASKDTKNAPATPKVLIKMSGQAVGYRSIALQSDLFTERDEGKNFIDPVFSNLVLDDKNGYVNFDLEFSVDLSFVDYKKMLLTQN